MDIANLRAFVAVSKTGNVARAAEELGLTSSPVSRSVRELEKALGRAVFVRRYHAMELTDFGAELLPSAVDIVSRFDHLVQAPRPLRVGCSLWVARRFHTRLRQFVREEGGVLEDDDTFALVRSLAHGELDLALVWGPLEVRGISTIPVATIPMVVRSATSLTPEAEIGLEELAGRPMVELPYGQVPSTQERFRSVLARYGIAAPKSLSFADVMRIEARLHRTGELLLMGEDEGMPLTEELSQTELHMARLRAPELEGVVLVAWRGEDTIHADVASRAAEAVRG
jgi:DNA-binding transcriptional LysR family regulator